MKNIDKAEIHVYKDGKRVDDHVLSFDLKFGTVCFTDKNSRVKYENNNHDGYEVLYK